MTDDLELRIRSLIRSYPRTMTWTVQNVSEKLQHENPDQVEEKLEELARQDFLTEGANGWTIHHPWRKGINA